VVTVRRYSMSIREKDMFYYAASCMDKNQTSDKEQVKKN
jgi:hypothetical protein